MTDPDAPPPEQPPWAPPPTPTPPPSYGAPTPPPPPPGTYPAGPYGAPHPGGQPPYGAYGYPQPRRTPGTAVWALVLGIASIVCCGLFTGIPAIIVGRSAMKEIDRSGGTKDGRGLAQAGFITGIVGTVLGVLAVIAIVISIIVAATTPDQGTSRPQVCRFGPSNTPHCTRT